LLALDETRVYGFNISLQIQTERYGKNQQQPYKYKHKMKKSESSFITTPKQSMSKSVTVAE
jgi:hypothetical protein